MPSGASTGENEAKKIRVVIGAVQGLGFGFRV